MSTIHPVGRTQRDGTRRMSEVIPYPPGVPPMSARVYRNVSTTAGLASYAHGIGE